MTAGAGTAAGSGGLVGGPIVGRPRTALPDDRLAVRAGPRRQCRAVRVHGPDDVGGTPRCRSAAGGGHPVRATGAARLYVRVAPELVLPQRRDRPAIAVLPVAWVLPWMGRLVQAIYLTVCLGIPLSAANVDPVWTYLAGVRPACLRERSTARTHRSGRYPARRLRDPHLPPLQSRRNDAGRAWTGPVWRLRDDVAQHPAS